MAAAQRRRAPMAAAGALALLASAASVYAVRNLVSAAWDANRAARAGFTGKRAEIDGSVLAYTEGPDNGPPLLLLHGQLTDRGSWNRVLPGLARRFHVFAVDCHGHGESARAPQKYTATALAADMERFLARVVGEPAVVAGHSSGGLIAAVLAAEAPQQVRGVVLEDPPFFSSVLPRAEKTFNHVDLSTTAHAFLRSGGTDFTDHYIRHAALWDLFQEGKDGVRGSALRYRERNPGTPLKLFYMPPVFNELFRAMPAYDPRFGDAFYTGRFHEGFDHAETLRRIAVPAVLLHARWSHDDDGILLAAMDGDDAERARSLIPDVEFHAVDSGHGFHFEKPRAFTRIVAGFAERIAG